MSLRSPRPPRASLRIRPAAVAPGTFVPRGPGGRPVGWSPWLRRSPCAPTACSTSPTTPSSRSSRATAPASTSGRRRSSILDAAAKKYGKAIAWKEVLAGEKAFHETGDWLPEQTVTDFREHLIGIKGPLTTPIGGGFRSLNVALRQILDLYVCLRPVRWFDGVPSPVKHPELVDMVIFRENTEDVYAGLEVEAGTAEAERLRAFLHDAFGWDIREMSGIGVKPISKFGSERLVRAALQYALSHGRPSRSRWCTRATSRSTPRARS